MADRIAPPPLPRTSRTPTRGRVLVVAPHPDDDVIGCGGAMALHVEQGDPVQVLVLSGGASGDPDGHLPPQRVRETREREAIAAGARLGVTDYVFWRYPDSHEVSEEDLTGVVQRLREHLGVLRPDVIYYPWEGEVHADHFLASLAVRRALPALPFRATALGYEVWTPCTPNWVLDISRVWSRKAEAIRQHTSQLRYVDYVSVALGLNAHRCLYLERGATHGEAFVLSMVGAG